jgi:antitoxin component YwqK of YwqJK toxin-antitoxin module
MTTGPQSTPPTVSPSLSSFVDPETLALARAALEANKKEKKPPKSGTFTRTYTSNNIPAASSIKDTINKVFQKYYGRDASETEITTWTPQILAKYKSKSGASRSTVKEVYKNGALISTEYLTADNEDPSIFLEERIKTQLASGKVEINELSIPEGPSGKYFVAVKNLAYDNGIKLSDNDALSYANKIVAGQLDENTVFNTIRESAASAFPSLADKIKAGLDLKTLASPYIQSMSDILEIPDTAIDLFDPQIRSAMAYTLPDGKVGTKSIYDFEKELRKDDRWQYTNKAREQAASVATTVLRDFGFMG